MDKIKDFFTELAEHPLLEQLVQLLTDNIWTVLAFAIATALTVIGLVYARKQEKRAQKQDAAVPELLVDLYGCADPEVKDFYFLLPFKEKRAIFVPLMINIGNKGPISADNVELHLQLSQHLYRSDWITRQPASVAAAREMKLGVDPVTGSSVVQVLVNCGTISPEVRFQFNDSVIVERETYLTQTIPVETKDNYKLTLKTHLYCWFEITVSVTTRDLPPQVHKYNLHFRQLHADPQKGFLEEEMQRRSQTTFEGMDDELRTQMLYASEITTLMKKLGMAYEVDQPLPEKLALVWFENEFVPDFVSPDHLPEGHDAIGVSDEKVGTLRAKTPGGKKSKKQKS